MRSRPIKLAIVWNNPMFPKKDSPKVKRVETGSYTAVYLVTKPGFTNRLAVLSKRRTWSLVTPASA